MYIYIDKNIYVTAPPKTYKFLKFTLGQRQTFE